MFYFQQYFFDEGVLFWASECNSLKYSHKGKALWICARSCSSSSRLSHLFLASSCVSHPFLSSSIWELHGLYLFAWLFHSLMQHWFLHSEQIHSQRNLGFVPTLIVLSIRKHLELVFLNKTQEIIHKWVWKNNLHSLKLSSLLQVMSMSWSQSHLQLNVGLI